MRIDEITRNFDPLRAQGWENYGEGLYATVMGSEWLPYVIKEFMTEDTAYLAYLKFLKSHSSPHYPVIRGGPVKFREGSMVVRMERLDRGPNLGLQWYGRDCPPRWKKESDASIAKTFSRFPELQGAIDAIADALPFRLDLHNGNILYRDGVPVLIDPVAIGS